MTNEPSHAVAQPKFVKSGATLSCICPHCRASLIDGTHMILEVERSNRQTGRLHLSPQLNVFDTSSTIDLEHGEEVADLRCSRCAASLQHDEVRCAECGSRVAQLLVEHGGDETEFYICLRKGCHWHAVSQAARSRLILEAVGFHRPDSPRDLIQSGTALACSCPHCSHPLVDEDDLLLKVKNATGQEGTLILSPKLNEFRNSCTITLPKGAPASDMSCPWCEKSLLTPERGCELCGAPTARIHVKTADDNVGFHICTRNGCHYHGLDDGRPGLLLERSKS